MLGFRILATGGLLVVWGLIASPDPSMRAVINETVFMWVFWAILIGMPFATKVLAEGGQNARAEQLRLIVDRELITRGLVSPKPDSENIDRELALLYRVRPGQGFQFNRQYLLVALVKQSLYDRGLFKPEYSDSRPSAGRPWHRWLRRNVDALVEAALWREALQEADASRRRLVTDRHQAVAAALEDAFARLSAAGSAATHTVEANRDGNRTVLTPAWLIFADPPWDKRAGEESRQDSLLIGVDGKVYLTRYHDGRETVWDFPGDLGGEPVGEIKSLPTFSQPDRLSTITRASVYSKFDPEEIRTGADRLLNP